MNVLNLRAQLVGNHSSYRADITAGSLKITESRVIADLLLSGMDETARKQATVKDNLLKAKNPATAIRLAIIDAQIAEIGRELDSVKADTGLKAACLHPVQEQRKQVENEPPAPVVKARCVIKPAEIVNKSCLETPEDVEAFIKNLRLQLDAAISNNQRIQIHRSR